MFQLPHPLSGIIPQYVYYTGSQSPPANYDLVGSIKHLSLSAFSSFSHFPTPLLVFPGFRLNICSRKQVCSQMTFLNCP